MPSPCPSINDLITFLQNERKEEEEEEGRQGKGRQEEEEILKNLGE